MKNADKPAMPVEIQASNDGIVRGVQTTEFSGFEIGLTKREYFAAMAMQSIVKIKGVGTYDLSRNYEGVCNDIAQASIRVADELLKQLES